VEPRFAVKIARHEGDSFARTARLERNRKFISEDPREMKIEQRNIKETTACGECSLLGRPKGDNVTPFDGRQTFQSPAEEVVIIDYQHCEG
jgi:hypothetical protein